MTTPPTMPKSNVFDLDAAERDDEQIDDFVATIRGREVTMYDPGEFDWFDLARIREPQELVKLAMSSEDFSYLLSQRLPAWRFNKLFEAWSRHFKLAERQADARRLAAASGLSSTPQ